MLKRRDFLKTTGAMTVLSSSSTAMAVAVQSRARLLSGVSTVSELAASVSAVVGKNVRIPDVGSRRESSVTGGEAGDKRRPPSRLNERHGVSVL